MENGLHEASTRGWGAHGSGIGSRRMENGSINGSSSRAWRKGSSISLEWKFLLFHTVVLSPYYTGNSVYSKYSVRGMSAQTRGAM